MWSHPLQHCTKISWKRRLPCGSPRFWDPFSCFALATNGHALDKVVSSKAQKVVCTSGSVTPLPPVRAHMPQRAVFFETKISSNSVCYLIHMHWHTDSFVTRRPHNLLTPVWILVFLPHLWTCRTNRECLRQSRFALQAQRMCWIADNHGGDSHWMVKNFCICQFGRGSVNFEKKIAGIVDSPFLKTNYVAMRSARLLFQHQPITTVIDWVL